MVVAMGVLSAAGFHVKSGEACNARIASSAKRRDALSRVVGELA